MERGMHKMAQKRKLFFEKHDREKVNFQTVIYFYKILNDACTHERVRAQAHTYTQTHDINFFPIHQLKNGFCITAQRNKNVLYKNFPKN